MFTIKVYVISILGWSHVIQLITSTEAFLGQNVTIIGLWLNIPHTITCQQKPKTVLSCEPSKYFIYQLFGCKPKVNSGPLKRRQSHSSIVINLNINYSEVRGHQEPLYENGSQSLDKSFSEIPTRNLPVPRLTHYHSMLVSPNL